MILALLQVFEASVCGRDLEPCQAEPICEGRMKTGIEPDMTLESQEEARESENLLKTGLRTGRQALMTPSRASRQVKRAMRE